MKKINYKQLKTKKFDSFERGHLVSCPAERGGHNPRKGDILIPRSSCVLETRGVCPVCPNSKFETILKDIGPPEAYEWLDFVINTACKIFDGKVISKHRGWGDCCLQHKGCIILKYEIQYDGVVDKISAKALYEAAVTSNSKTGTHELVHFKVNRWDKSMRIIVALR